MTALRWEIGEPPEAFVDFCAGALPEVYGYLLARCGDRATAEDLTSAAFEAALSAVRRATVTDLSTGWLIVVARRRLIDHLRREERDARRVAAFACDEIDAGFDDWGDAIDPPVGIVALARLGPHHRAALTLRYVDGLSVTEVARELVRGHDATEALLQRARRAFRRAYEEVRTHA